MDSIDVEIKSLIDAELESGIPLNKIIVGMSNFIFLICNILN